LRALIGVLRAEGEAAPLAPVASLAALDELAARTSQAGVSTTVDVDGNLDAVPAGLSAAAFRIVQEAVTNVVRHSQATRARIVVHLGDDALEVSVTDNGRGPGVSPEGAGLRGMRERASALGGSVRLGPGSDGGARLHATLPLGGGA
jgi:signal transduction histidine kinase